LKVETIQMRIYAKLGGLGLVVPILQPKERISKLMSEIAERLESSGRLELRIAELRAGNCLLSPRDIIEDVVRDSDSIEVVDYSTWIQEQLKYCNKVWTRLSRPDLEDNKNKWVEVGLHDLNKIFIKLGITVNGIDEITKTEIFDIDALQYFSKDGQISVASKEGEGKKWTLEALFLVEKGLVKEIKIRVKSSNDKKPTTQTIPIALVNKAIVQNGDVTTIEDEKVVYNPQDYVSLLPKRIEEGPQITPEPIGEALAPINAVNNKSVLEVAFTGLLEPVQRSSGDTLTQLLNLNFALANRTQSTLSVEKVTAEYKCEDKWVPVKACLIGTRRRFFDYNYDLRGDTNFKIASKVTYDLAVRASIQVKAKVFDDRRQIHQSLLPLQLRVTFLDMDGGTAVVEIDVKSNQTQVELPNKEKILKDLKLEPLLWSQCDDPELLGRIWVVAGMDESGDLNIRNSQYGYCLSKASLDAAAYTAVKEGVSELEYKDLAYSCVDGLCTVKGYFLVDLENCLVYGMKFELKTSTSRVVDSFAMPILTK